MASPLPWVAALGLALIVEALLARYELLAYSVGWRSPTTELAHGLPRARGAALELPPKAYLVYLDGIGKRHSRDTRDGGRLVEALIRGAPEFRILGQVQPYSPLAAPLAERPVWSWLRRRVGILLFFHNVMQTFVAADRRYRPLYNRAVGAQIASQLQRAGYRASSGIPVVLVSYSGGAQVATGSIKELYERLQCPLSVILLGGFHNGTNDLSKCEHVHQLTSAKDRIERVGVWMFPPRWPVFRWSAWNRARRAGKVTVERLDPATHVGHRSYISPTALLPDGRSYLERTAAVVIALARADADSPHVPEHGESCGLRCGCPGPG